MNSTIESNSASLFASKFVNNTNCHVFLTGKAGTGKTTFLKNVIQSTFKKVVVAAPTGIAAINAGGVTLHSLFLLPFGSFVPTNNIDDILSANFKLNNKHTLLKEVKMNSYKRKLLQEMELLIIDEVSMLRADLLDAIDVILKSVRRNNSSFGGVQLLFIGDLQQLPPVIKETEWNVLKSYYKSPFFFDATVLADNPPIYIELEKIYRQTDQTFIQLLNNLRDNKVSDADVDLLNQFYQPDFKIPKNENYIKLTTHNAIADELNKSELSKLPGKSFYFTSSVEGEFNENAFPLDLTMELKMGAQIMFIKNDPTGAQRFFNGKIGIISAIDNDKIEVEFSENSMKNEMQTKTVLVDKYTWKSVRFNVNQTTNEIEEELLGTFTQYPIKLAWAITVHKSQGLTFDKAIIDTERAFAPGQVYVALSRLTSLGGLVLSSKVNFKSLENDAHVTDYSKNKSDKTELNIRFTDESHRFIKQSITKAFDFTNLLNQVKSHKDSYSQKDESKSVKRKYTEWAVELEEDVIKMNEVAEKFVIQIKKIIASNEDYISKLTERILAAKEYFFPMLKDGSKKLLKHIEELKTKKKVKAYTSEIIELESFFYKQVQLIHQAEAILKSAKEGAEFTKLNIIDEDEKTSRVQEFDEIKTTSKQKKSKEKKEKVDTKKVSFDLYRLGKSCKEIANERGLSFFTIEGHLAHYVGLGMIDVNNFVSSSKRDEIIATSIKLDTLLLAEIKNSLGDEFSFSEIKFAMAYFQNMNKNSNG